MASDPRKRQKKHEKLAKKRKIKRHELVSAKSVGLTDRMIEAAGCPVLHCWIMQNIFDDGIGYACLSRLLRSGHVVYSLFLIDRYCLGVKKVVYRIASRLDYETQINRNLRSKYTLTDMAPAALRKLVEGAVDYAKRLGLSPHPDYYKANILFGTIDASTCTQEFEYGQDGKPFYISGPHETLADSHRILETIRQHTGGENVESIVCVNPDSEMSLDNLVVTDENVIGGDTPSVP